MIIFYMNGKICTFSAADEAEEQALFNASEYKNHSHEHVPNTEVKNEQIDFEQTSFKNGKFTIKKKPRRALGKQK